MYSSREINRMKGYLAGRLFLVKARRVARELLHYAFAVFVGSGVVVACLRFWWWVFW